MIKLGSREAMPGTPNRIFPVSWFDALFYPLLFILLIGFAFEKNFPEGKPTYGGEFYSDKGAYYIYLPATFILGFTSEKYPDSIDYKHAGGFVLDKKTGKVITKVTYGVALLSLPFFLPTHALATWMDANPDGFSMFYQRMAVVSSIFYLVLSLFLLKLFLSHYFRKWLAWLIPLMILFGTNLLYYGIDDGMMSHLYSFFLISLLLVLLKYYFSNGSSSFPMFLGICIVLSLLILIRPTHLLLLFLLVFLDVSSFRETVNRLRHFLRPLYIGSFLLIILLLFIPQMLYWHFISGEWVYFSYPGEGFTNWNHPMLIPFWFSPLNGLFLYSPFTFLFIIGFFIMILRKIQNGLLLTLLFLIYSYVFSSWHSWYFGGSFGCRPMIDFYPLFAMAIGYVFTFFSERKNILLKVIPSLFALFAIWFNLKLFNNKQFYTGGTWSWEIFKEQMHHAGIAHFPRSTYVYSNDFENISMDFGFPSTRDQVHSGTKSSFLDEEMDVQHYFSREIARILVQEKLERVEVECWVYPENLTKTGAFLVCEIKTNHDSLVFSRAIPVDAFVKTNNAWAAVVDTIRVPAYVDKDNIISFSIANPEKKRFFVDDFILRFF